MKNEYTFNYPLETVYRVIADLVVDNANAHVEEKYSIDNLESIDYEYTIQTAKSEAMNYVKVQEVRTNEHISYTIKREKLEKYLVSFDLESLSDHETLLNYKYEIVTEKARTSMNYQLMAFFYKRRHNKHFKAMCSYLENKCYELQSASNLEG